MLGDISQEMMDYAGLTTGPFHEGSQSVLASIYETKTIIRGRWCKSDFHGTFGLNIQQPISWRLPKIASLRLLHHPLRRRYTIPLLGQRHLRVPHASRACHRTEEQTLPGSCGLCLCSRRNSCFLLPQKENRLRWANHRISHPWSLLSKRDRQSAWEHGTGSSRLGGIAPSKVQVHRPSRDLHPSRNKRHSRLPALSDPFRG